jgi:hypothetical protein
MTNRPFVVAPITYCVSSPSGVRGGHLVDDTSSDLDPSAQGGFVNAVATAERYARGMAPVDELRIAWIEGLEPRCARTGWAMS